MNFEHFSISDVGRVRSANEDNCGSRMTANGYVFVVCDGMGGHVGGATASKIAIDSILDFFENPVQNIYVGINDAFKFANSQIYNTAIEDSSLKGMGTTGTILVVKDEACFIGHVGDSRIYLKSDDKLNRITKDHSFVQSLVDQGIISDDESEEHPKKNQILQAIGIKPDVEPTVCAAPIHPKLGDCFLLCSDGLNGMIKDPEIEKLIEFDNLEVSCRALIDAANNAGGKDNVTATLVAITESPYRTSVFVDFNPVKGVGEATVIEPSSVNFTPQKKSKSKIIAIGSIGLLLIAFCIWFFTRPENTKVIIDPPIIQNDTIVKKDSVELEDKEKEVDTQEINKNPKKDIDGEDIEPVKEEPEIIPEKPKVKDSIIKSINSEPVKEIIEEELIEEPKDSIQD